MTNEVVKARGFPKGSLERNPTLSQWLSLAQPGVILLSVGKVDIGQGISTAIVQIAAEELDVDLRRVRLVPITTAHSPDEGVTSGSFSIEHSGQAVRLACATLRGMAAGQFAARHGVDASSVRVSDGTLSAPGAAAATYWDLGLQGMLDRPVSTDPELKKPADYTLVQSSLPRIDLPRKVFGRPSFIQDMVLPGMLHARVVRVANRAARLVEVDLAAFQGRYPDVQVVRDGSFLGVLAEREEVAIAAATRLRSLARWNMPAVFPDSSDLEGFLRGTPAEQTILVARSADAASSAHSFQADYMRPFIAHASIGPSCALAQWSPGKLEVWTHSQGIFNFKSDLDSFLRREQAGGASVVESIVHHVEGAGCYGHNPADDVGFDAVLLARAAGGRPVRVAWSRADELCCGPSGSAHLVELKAQVSAAADILEWSHELWANGYTSRPGRATPGALSFKAASEIERPFDAPVALDPPLSAGGGTDRNAIPDYDFPGCRVVSNRLLEMPIRTSAIRALGGYTNVFAIESFMDEIAQGCAQDPVLFRLRHLSSDPRARAVIERCIGQAAWWHERSGDPEGTGRGMAFARYKNTGAWCAVAVKVIATTQIRVEQISIAADVGLAVNPEGVRSQLEGGAIQSCSWTLKEALNFDRENFTTSSWEDYPILRFSEAPPVQVSIIDAPHEPSLGAGEATQGPTAAAIGNAVFDALGVRVRRLPITPEQIRSAM